MSKKIKSYEDLSAERRERGERNRLSIALGLDARSSIVGYCTNKGYLLCAACVGSDDPPVYDARGPFAVHRDSNPHAFELCERCGQQLNAGTGVDV